MVTFGRFVMRALMFLTTLLIATGAFLAAQTPFQHVTVALMIFLYCTIRFIGLTIIERSELGMINAQQLAAIMAERSGHSEPGKFTAALEQAHAERRESRLRATVECGLLTILAFYAALTITTPSLLAGWP